MAERIQVLVVDGEPAVAGAIAALFELARRASAWARLTPERSAASATREPLWAVGKGR